MTEHVLIVGATSGIGVEIARAFARRGARLVVAGRRAEALDALARDLRIRSGASVDVAVFDATDFASHAPMVEAALHALDGRLDGAVLCHGFMADDAKVRADAGLLRTTIDVNLTSVVHVAERVADVLAPRGSGWIAALSSVAGDRGRQSNYVYGCAKAGLSTYLQGLRNRLFASGVHVLTVEPGFVLTAMTRDRLDPESPLVASPERVAADVVRAIDRRRNVVYTPWFWRAIMAVVRGIPESLFKRMKL